MRLHVSDLRFQFDEMKSNQFTSLILNQFQEIDKLMKNLVPFKRQKRWDTIGTVWKFIAGSPDANDLRLINSSINSLIVNNNEQVRINREINLQMKEFVHKTKEAIILFNSQSLDIHSINIFLNLKYLSEKLQQILDSITLAKIGILNEKLLSQKEITILLADLARENITVHSAWEAITYATTSIATNNQEIALLIKLPKLDQRVFTKMHIYPILQESQQIHLKNQLYLTHETAIYKVKSLQPTIFGINDIELDNTTCVPRLIAGQPAICNYTFNPLQEEIIGIDNHHILINSKRTFVLKTDCGITERNLSGSYIISYDNCKIHINDKVHSSHIIDLTGDPIHLPLDGVTIEKQSEIANLSLEHLHNLHLETRKDLNLIRLTSNSLHWKLIGGFSLPLFIGIICSLVIIFRRNARVKIQIGKPQDTSSIAHTNNFTFRNLTHADVIRMEPHVSGGSS